jgi:hypothetical protein
VFKKNLCSLPLIIILLSSAAFGGVAIFPANQEFSSPARWHNVPNVYIDDGLYAIDTCSSNKLDTFSVGLADPIDTLNKQITNVTIYAKARTHYPKAMFWLWPVYNDIGYRSGNLKIGTTETLYSFDITPQDTALADSTWNWNDITGLGIRFHARTTKVIYFVNYMFAAVTYVDTVDIEQTHHFQVDPIASPETVGVYFPLNVSVLDSLGNPYNTYNGSALLTDLTGTLSPVTISFTNGIGSIMVAVNDTISNNFITIDDGVAKDTSNLFNVVNSGLHHFVFDSIGAQTKNVPFGITVTAMDFFDDPVTTFTGKADINDKTTTITPDSTGPFVSGIWSGSVNIAAGILSDTIFCSYFNGKSIPGTSNVFTVTDPSGISGDKPASPSDARFSLNISPNPARDNARFIMNIPKAGRGELIIYNILGQTVIRKELENLSPGQAEVNMNFASSFPQGLYFVRATLNGEMTALKKLLVMR